MDFDESNCHSMSDNFSFYQRYMRSFSLVDRIDTDNTNIPNEIVLSNSTCAGFTEDQTDNVDGLVRGRLDYETADAEVSSVNSGRISKIDAPLTLCSNASTEGSSNTNLCERQYCASPSTLLDNSFTEGSIHLHENINPIEIPITSDESKPFTKQPVFITAIMENSNNAVDSVPMFNDVRQKSVFKLPLISELSFNGTIKHVQKLKPIVDPITALTGAHILDLNEQNPHTSSNGITKEVAQYQNFNSDHASSSCSIDNNSNYKSCSTSKSDVEDGVKDKSKNTMESQYKEVSRNEPHFVEDSDSYNWNMDQSHSSLEASFDSGVRSPDMFSDEDEESRPASKPFCNYLKDVECYEKRKIRKFEQTLQGILPPPSVTVLKIDVAEMLKRYYRSQSDQEQNIPEIAESTPTKGVSYIDVPLPQPEEVKECCNIQSNNLLEFDKPMKSAECSKESDATSEKSVSLNMGTETEAKQTSWPNVLKCRYYDVYYNLTNYSEKLENLAQRYGARYVGAETDTSVCVYSTSTGTPTSAAKRKALRLKMAQTKSPGRRLSHLARRRQAFCSAATFHEKTQSSSSKMVLIDKNYFPHRKLVKTSEWRSPRGKRTPGKKTPVRKTKTPGKITPSRTPKTKSGGSSHKKAMRRLLMDSESVTRSQPTRLMTKRALFVSPDKRNPIPTASTSSVPMQAMKSKRNLFGSPEAKSLDGSLSENFLKRKLDALDDEPLSSRSKVAKSLSFGGDTLNHSQNYSLNRRVSENGPSKNAANMNEVHKKKLLWAVTEALRVHGWRMCSPGFREKASTLARLTRKLLSLPPHAARFATPGLSTSDTMFKLARKYVFAVIQGRTVDECFQQEQDFITNETNKKLTGYISSAAYEQLKNKPASTFASQVKENTCNSSDMAFKPELPKTATKNVLQDKLVNIDSNSSSSGSGMSLFDKSVPLFKSNSMPSFEEAAKMRARRQISFDNVDFPKR